MKDFLRINASEVYGSKVNEDPQIFINKVYKILDIMGWRSDDKVELAAYQLKGVAQTWYDQWREEKEVNNVVMCCQITTHLVPKTRDFVSS